MENKKLGIILITISFLIGLVLISIISNLRTESKAIGCFPNERCSRIASVLNISHFVVGIMSFILALGVYLMIFSKSEYAILKHLEDNKNKGREEEKFNIMLRMLDENEKKVIKSIREQEGILQSTLTIRTGLSRSKISEVLKGFEAKNLIKRKNKGRTFSVYLTELI